MNHKKEFMKLKKQFDEIEQEINDAMIWDIGHYRITI